MSCSGVDGLLNIWRKRSPPFNCLFLIFIVAGGLLFLLGNLFVPWGMVYGGASFNLCRKYVRYDICNAISNIISSNR